MVGGVKRVNLDSGEDLVNLEHLDPKLWTALSCPVNDLEIDKKTLEIIDTDKDGQIRVPDVIAAVKWMTAILKNPDDLLKKEGMLPLQAINDQTAQGKILLDSARVILKNLGKEDANIISVDETSDREKIFAGTRFNGDGIITEDTTGDEELLKLVNEVIQYAGSVTDRGGKQGISMVLIATFFEQCEKYAAWYAKKYADEKGIFPLGADTEDAYANFSAIKSKVDDFFIRCRLAAFDPQSTEVLNLQAARVETITAHDLTNCLAEIAAYPITKVEANKSLPVSSGINPAWEQAIATFKRLTVDKLFPGNENINEQEWNSIAGTFAGYAKWMQEKEGAAVEPLGHERVNKILSGNNKEQLLELIAQDNAVETEANNIIEVDKLARYYRDLYQLLQNFVTFHDFYTPGSKAIFQAGTLYIDQKSCDLCIKVQDMPKHGKLDSFSGIFLLYCDCLSRTSAEKMTIVAAVTNGDIDNLMVGRNALFYDRQGRDWDATITKIVDNPISIRQAFFSPYRKLMTTIENQINKAAATADAKASADINKGVEGAKLKQEDADKKEPPKPFDVGKFAGIFAAIGLAIGAIGGFLVSIGKGFSEMPFWKIPLAIMGILLLISGPAMIMAYLKLRKRNLAPILDSNGWAINAMVIINIRFGGTLTQLAALPKGAKVNLNDPFTKKKKPVLPALIVILLVVGVILYLLQKYGFIHIRF